MKFVSRLCLVVLLSIAGAAIAQQAPAPAPSQPEDRVKEQQQRATTQPGNNAPVWREVRSGQSPYTNSTVKGRETDVLVQSWGETWRQIRNGPVMFYGGWLLVLAIAAILGLYMWKGPVRLTEPPTGRLMRRFSAFEMTVHWSTAISFCLLGITGLTMFFGKHVLLPVMGYTLFAWLTQLSKYVHNFIAPLFIVSVIAMVLLFVRHNLPKSYDFQFLANAW